MVYLFGLVGFVFAFSVGLGLINVILRKKTKEQLQEKNIRMKYGLMVWALAILGGWGGVTIYNQFFY